MKKIVTLIIAVAALCGTAFAQSRNSYFMEGSYFRTDMNPALAPTRGFFAMPAMGGVGFNLNNNFLSIDNFIYQRDGELVTGLHEKVSSEEFLRKLPNRCNAGVNLQTNLFGLGFYTGRLYWNIGANLKVQANVSLPSDLFVLCKRLGNGTFDLGATGVNANTYFETYLGTSIPIGKHVRIGARVKYLTGLLYADVNLNNSSLTLGEDKITAEMHASGVVASPILHTEGVSLRGKEAIENLDLEQLFNPDLLNMQIEGSDFKSLMKPVQTVFRQFKSWGLAADLGVEVSLLDDHLRISAAVTDLGFIRYRNTQTISLTGLNGSAYFNGVNIEKIDQGNGTDYGFEIADGIIASSGSHHMTMLNCTLNAGIEYNILNNHIAFGVLSHTEFINKHAFPELTASVNFRATNWLTATFSHTFLNKHAPGVLGFALNIHPRVLNIFVGLDYIDTRFGVYNMTSKESGKVIRIPIPRYMNSINAYFGFGFNFARPKWMREK
ncbi:MAG: hypothetical protein IJ348_02385 [Alistipes sp.]|nr:hypothetical protein [Alistipes sp.]